MEFLNEKQQENEIEEKKKRKTQKQIIEDILNRWD